MRWIRTPNGRFDHAVFHGQTRTACGSSIAGATIVKPGFDRCLACLERWEELGRQEKPTLPDRRPNRSEYQPRFTFKDWDQ